MTVCIVLFTCESGGITVTIAQSPKITYTVHQYTHQINPVVLSASTLSRADTFLECHTRSYVNPQALVSFERLFNRISLPDIKPL